MKKLFLLTSSFFFTACTTPSETIKEAPIEGATTNIQTVSDRLNKSPRHHEWVEVQNGDKTIYNWVSYPERSEKAPVVLIIHENRGLNDWARSLADQVAEAGYIAVAPDLLSNFSEEFDRTSDFADDDAARDALYELDPAQVQSDLKAVANYAKSIEASNGKLATAGFCWGGAKSFEFATQSDQADAIMVFYGTSPEVVENYANIQAPVYGFYGEDDERVNSTIERAKIAMTESTNTFEIEVYDGAGHAFMRLGEATDGTQANINARTAAWEKMKTILSELEG